MEEFLFWFARIVRAIVVAFPFIVAAIFAYMVLDFLGISFSGIVIPMVIVIVILIGHDLKTLFK